MFRSEKAQNSSQNSISLIVTKLLATVFTANFPKRIFLPLHFSHSLSTTPQSKSIFPFNHFHNVLTLYFKQKFQPKLNKVRTKTACMIHPVFP